MFCTYVYLFEHNEQFMVYMFQTWPQNWLYSRHGTDIPVASEVGLDWLLTLWAYRDAEVHTYTIYLDCINSMQCTVTELQHDKTGLQGFRPGQTQFSLYSHRSRLGT